MIFEAYMEEDAWPMELCNTETGEIYEGE